jgi:hypothetical protein
MTSMVAFHPVVLCGGLNMCSLLCRVQARCGTNACAGSHSEAPIASPPHPPAHTHTQNLIQASRCQPQW